MMGGEPEREREIDRQKDIKTKTDDRQLVC